MGDTVEGIFILDDIVGFINEEHYKEFAHPYLKRICDACPQGLGQGLSQRRRSRCCLDHLPDAGFKCSTGASRRTSARSRRALAIGCA